MAAGINPTNVLTVMHEQDQALRQALQEYARTVPQQAEVVQSFLALLADQEPDPFCRERLAGHFTGSAWLVSADG